MSFRHDVNHGAVQQCPHALDLALLVFHTFNATLQFDHPHAIVYIFDRLKATVVIPKVRPVTAGFCGEWC